MCGIGHVRGGAGRGVQGPLVSGPARRPALTKKLEKIGGGERFSGEAPGAPGRWSKERSAEWVAVRDRLVVEVQYDQVSGGLLRHGTHP